MSKSGACGRRTWKRSAIICCGSTSAAGTSALAAACRTTSSSHYAEHCFGKGDLLYGAFVDGRLIGAAELRSNQAIWSEQAPFGRHIHAEAAFSVEEGYRRRGVGEELFKRIERAASNHGVETIDIVCTPDNVGMQRLAEKFKTVFTFEENSLAGRLTARRPTAFSLMREASGDVLDFGASLVDARLRALAGSQTKSG